ncbi:uncharacterized protein LOC114872523 [Osmia bicornis bicornis]|uniref:uncharacterized protein LOC114872523 n=1 Tax=Osmia bicornis bicornis TaxID=1437191 RepID=UPI001EAE912F|nr:uncharacterized protein LOC114872523 [Osmia bicornis bicornis]
MDQLQVYYKQTIFVLSAVGLWPYQNKYFRLVYNIFIIFMYLSFFYTQIAAMTNTKHTLHYLLRCIFYLSVGMGSLLKYCTYYLQADTIKHLMEEVKHDWKTENDETLEILRNFANLGKHYIFYFVSFIFIGCEMCNSILDAVAPLNYTRPYVIPAVYFVDERKYRFLILIYQSFAFLMCVAVYVGTESLIIMWLHHFSALYVLVSYYIYQGVMEHISHTSNEHLGNSKRLLITAAVIHRRVIKYMNIFENVTSLSYVFLLLFATISQSINIFILSQTIFKLEANIDTVLYLTFAFTELIYIFCMIYIVQQYLNISENVSLQIYNTNWYEASLSTQKFLLFIMMKTSEERRFKLFIFVNPNLEGFVQSLGLFEVIRHRIQNAFSKETLNIPGIKKEKIVQQKLVQAIELHQRIHCIYSHGESVVSFSYFLVLLVGVAITILSLLRLSQLKIELSTLKILVMEIYLIFICFAYIFLINHLCQTVQNSSTKLLLDVYDNLWYLAPVSSQKLLLFMMQNSRKNIIGPAGGIFLPGHEGCIKLIKMSFSYFMVIRSVQS